MSASYWLVNKLSADDVIDVVLHKKRLETSIDGVYCVVKSMCDDSVVAYLFARAFVGAPPEVRAAGYKLLKDAFRRGGLYHEDERVFRRTREVFGDDIRSVLYTDEHMRQARELIAKELRSCAVCEVDAYTLFERFVRCVEISGDGYMYVIPRGDRGVIHVFGDSPADALGEINRRLMAQYRVIADEDVETFEALTKIYAKTLC